MDRKCKDCIYYESCHIRVYEKCLYLNESDGMNCSCGRKVSWLIAEEWKYCPYCGKELDK